MVFWHYTIPSFYCLPKNLFWISFPFLDCVPKEHGICDVYLFLQILSLAITSPSGNILVYIFCL
ncbi:hypothetical protein ACJX0J_006795, partial [Zea mays]